MARLIIALIFCVLGTINGVNVKNQGEQSSESYEDEPTDTDLQSIDSLAEITSAEVLPLMIFINLTEDDYEMPEKLVKFELNEGKIANGTKFMPRVPGYESMFCPRENSDEKCLIRTSFEGSEPLRCSSEPKPQWINIEQPCVGGDMNSGKMFLSAYTICKTEDHHYNPKFVNIYEICYDTQLHKVMYASYVIKSTGLLNLKLLTEERKINFPIMISDDSTFSNHVITSEILNQETGNSKKPQYRLQQFVSHADMTFGIWKKTTFNHLNYEWQHGKLFNLWNEICANIRSIAKKYSTSDDNQFLVNTAIIDINSSSEDDDQFSNIWIKMAFAMKWDPSLGPLHTHGVAILMNNFLQENESSNLRHAAIEKYCTENLCIDELTNKFTEIGGRIRCCAITPQILQHFRYEIEVKEELRVPNVTVKEGED